MRDVCIGASVQGVLQRDERKQRRPGVFAIPQRNHIRLRWGMRKLTVWSPAAVSTSLLERFVFSASFSLSLPLCVSFTQLLSKPKFSSVEKIKTIGSTYMAAAGLTQLAPGDERKVCDPEVTALGYYLQVAHRMTDILRKGIWICKSRLAKPSSGLLLKCKQTAHAPSDWILWSLAPPTEMWHVLQPRALHGGVRHRFDGQTRKHQHTLF